LTSSNGSVLSENVVTGQWTPRHRLSFHCPLATHSRRSSCRSHTDHYRNCAVTGRNVKFLVHAVTVYVQMQTVTNRQTPSLACPANKLGGSESHMLRCCFFLVYLFFNDFRQTNYLKICRTDLHHSFRVGRTLAMDDQSEIGFSIPQRTLPWQPIFWFYPH